MKRRHLPYLAAAAALLAAALLLAHRFGWFDTSTAPVVLPETSPYAAPSPPEGRGGLVPAKVTPETVQAVVATLSRPDGYSRRLQVVSSWLGGEAAWQVRVWHKGTATRIRITPEAEGEPEKDVLILDKEIRIRYDGDERVFQSSAGSPALTDALQLIPSYEDVLALEPGQIEEAGYVEQDGVWRILVAAREEPTGYLMRYYVSIETGLLEAADRMDGTDLIYSMRARQADLAAPEDEVFRPDWAFTGS